MKKWFIPAELIRQNEIRAKNSTVGRCEITKHRIVLYDKNAMKNYYFSNPIKSAYFLGYIVERKSCPNYFKEVIREF